MIDRLIAYYMAAGILFTTLCIPEIMRCSKVSAAKRGGKKETEYTLSLFTGLFLVIGWPLLVASVFKAAWRKLENGRSGRALPPKASETRQA